MRKKAGVRRLQRRPRLKEKASQNSQMRVSATTNIFDPDPSGNDANRIAPGRSYSSRCAVFSPRRSPRKGRARRSKATSSRLLLGGSIPAPQRRISCTIFHDQGSDPAAQRPGRDSNPEPPAFSTPARDVRRLVPYPLGHRGSASSSQAGRIKGCERNDPRSELFGRFLVGGELFLCALPRRRGRGGRLFGSLLDRLCLRLHGCLRGRGLLVLLDEAGLLEAEEVAEVRDDPDLRDEPPLVRLA